MFEYAVVTAINQDIEKAATALASGVQGNAKEGWKPQGGVAAMAHQIDGKLHYVMHQAVVREGAIAKLQG